MEKYRLVEEHKGEGDDFLEPALASEVKITQQGKPRNYISYAMGLFVRDMWFDERTAVLSPFIDSLSLFLSCSHFILSFIVERRFGSGGLEGNGSSH